MSEYEFTQDWFHWAPEVWKQLIPLLPEGETYGAAKRPVRRFLEIGSFEGRSTIWTVENMMRDGDTIDCIDTWEGGEEHGDQDMAAVEKRFDNNACAANGYYGGSRLVSKFKGTSTKSLARFLDDPSYTEYGYDFIYIDGSHVAKDVMTDACMAWPLLKKGGILVFDDYLWGEPLPLTHKPKIAIDCFTTLFAEELEFLHIGYQLIVRKK